jgi:hypothetical protein
MAVRNAWRLAMRLGPFLFVGVFLLLIWTAALLIFHVTDIVIHVFVLFAIISFVMHFFWSKPV